MQGAPLWQVAAQSPIADRTLDDFSPASAIAGSQAPATLQPAALNSVEPSRPTLTQMARSATRSAVQFAAGGGKVTSAELHQIRLDTCRSCEQLAGARCEACSCFVAVKTWLPHENCPLGKWPGGNSAST
jgi:hypothetical protein